VELPTWFDSKSLGESIRVEIVAPNPKPELQTRFCHLTSQAHSTAPSAGKMAPHPKGHSRTLALGGLASAGYVVDAPTPLIRLVGA
jgi:hypothetical protein